VAELRLLGGFAVRSAGVDVSLPRHARRVLAYLSLEKMSETDPGRHLLADRLWPDAPAERARASLRTALWRIRQVCPVLVSSDSITVTLADSVWVDVYHFRFVAEHLLAGNAELGPNHLRLIRCAVELLPGWDEDWLILAREQLRQLRLHALEASARRMLHRGQYSDAIDTMLAVVAEEPLRESAQSALIEAHLAEGNIAEAHRQCAAYSEQLWTELQLRPSSELLRRVGLTTPPRG
jgi:DNA-binding SARP family transcriptional activator